MDRSERFGFVAVAAGVAVVAAVAVLVAVELAIASESETNFEGKRILFEIHTN